jgi:hypothetical protein
LTECAIDPPANPKDVISIAVQCLQGNKDLVKLCIAAVEDQRSNEHYDSYMSRTVLESLTKLDNLGNEFFDILDLEVGTGQHRDDEWFTVRSLPTLLCALPNPVGIHFVRLLLFHVAPPEIFGDGKTEFIHAVLRGSRTIKDLVERVRLLVDPISVGAPGLQAAETRGEGRLGLTAWASIVETVFVNDKVQSSLRGEASRADDTVHELADLLRLKILPAFTNTLSCVRASGTVPERDWQLESALDRWHTTVCNALSSGMPNVFICAALAIPDLMRAEAGLLNFERVRELIECVVTSEIKEFQIRLDCLKVALEIQDLDSVEKLFVGGLRVNSASSPSDFPTFIAAAIRNFVVADELGLGLRLLSEAISGDKLRGASVPDLDGILREASDMLERELHHRFALTEILGSGSKRRRR